MGKAVLVMLQLNGFNLPTTSFSKTVLQAHSIGLTTVTLTPGKQVECAEGQFWQLTTHFFLVLWLEIIVEQTKTKATDMLGYVFMI